MIFTSETCWAELAKIVIFSWLLLIFQPNSFSTTTGFPTVMVSIENFVLAEAKSS